MCYRLILMLCCVLNALVPITDAVPEKNLYVMSYKNKAIACAQTEESPLVVMVIEGEPFKLPVKLNRPRYFIDHILCQCVSCLHNSLDSEITLFNNTISINKIKSNMAGVWSCRILTDKDGQTQPQITYEDKKYAVAYCFVRVHIRSKETPQTLLVNNMIIPTEVMPLTDREVDNYAEYNFLEGDTVDVSCIPGDNVNKALGASITLYYDYAANLDEGFKQQMSRSNNNGFGFRTKLQSHHNNSILTCHSIDSQDSAKIKMKFVLQDHKIVYSHLSINGLTSRMRVGDPNCFRIFHSEYNYLFFEYEQLNIVCDTIRSEVHVGFSEQSCKNQSTISVSNIFTSPVTTRHCYKCKNGTIVEDISFSVKQLSIEFQETVKLTVDLPANNIVMEWYKYGDPYDRKSWIYYEFDEGDHVTLKYSYQKTNVNAIPEISLTLNHTSVSNGESVTLTSAYDKATFMCKVTEKQGTSTPQIETLYKQIFVTFHMKVITTTLDSTTTEARYNIALCPTAPTPVTCRPTVTKLRSGTACARQTIFEENFDTLRDDIWQIEQYIPVYSTEFPFVSYQRLPEDPTVTVTGGNLRIAPKLQHRQPGFTESSIYTGSLDLFSGCTATAEECRKDAWGASILPPIISGKITLKSFAFTYGTVYVRAKLPQGDWIYPEILLEPFLNKYGSVKYSSGVIKIASARGNRQLRRGTTDYSNKVLFGGPIMEFQCHNTLLASKVSNTGQWGDDFHEYAVRWSPERIILSVDGVEWARVEPAASGFSGRFSQTCGKLPRNLLAAGTKMAPFDDHFYLTLGVAVGGIIEFPDGVVSSDERPKPWTNRSNKGLLHFWEDMDAWLATWNQPEMLVDYVKVVAL